MSRPKSQRKFGNNEICTLRCRRVKSSGISLTGGQWPCRQSRVRQLDVSHLRICPSDHLRCRLTDIGLVGRSTWPLVVNCAVLCLLTREIARIRTSTDCGCRASLDILRQDVKSDVSLTNCASCCEHKMSSQFVPGQFRLRCQGRACFDTSARRRSTILSISI